MSSSLSEETKGETNAVARERGGGGGVTNDALDIPQDFAEAGCGNVQLGHLMRFSSGVVFVVESSSDWLGWVESLFEASWSCFFFTSFGGMLSVFDFPFGLLGGLPCRIDCCCLISSFLGCCCPGQVY